MGYGEEHERLRRALVAGFIEGTLCSLCGKPMWSAQPLDLGHVSDADGRSVPGRWAGLQHASCNRSVGARVNPWGIRARAPAARAARSPERSQQLADRAARRQRKLFRAEFDAAQKQD